MDGNNQEKHIRIVNTDKFYDIFNKDITPEKIKSMKTVDFIHELINRKLIASETDANLFILEGLQKAYEEVYDFPIRYYDKDEELDNVEDTREYLTDDYIKQNFNTEE